MDWKNNYPKENRYYETDNGILYLGDSLKIMKNIPAESTDLILTDPPYNIGKDFENDNMIGSEYLNWCKKWIFYLDKVLKWGGAIWITLGWHYVAEIKCLFNKYKDLRLKNWIIWYRQDGWKGDKGFAQSYEHVLYFIKDNITEKIQMEFKTYLNKKRKEKGLTLLDINKYFGWATNGGGCASTYMGDKKDNHLPTRKHYIMLKKYLGLDNRFDWLPFGVKFNKVDEYNDVWLTPKSEHNRLGHPTQKPVKLFERIILCSTDNANEIVLDPFMGSGTTAVVAEKLGRRWIGIELNPKYCEIAKKRIDMEAKQMKLDFI